MEKRILNKSGDTRWVRITIAPQPGPQGELKYLIAVMEDITERKEIELKIEKVNRELKSANDLLESVMHIAMHDLRGPVGNLLSIFHLMEDDEEGLLKEKFLSFFKQSLNKLHSTINGLTEVLHFMSANKIIAQNIDLEELLPAIVSEFKSQHRDANISIKLNGVKEMVYIQPFLESIIKNLIGNAIKYRSRRSPSCES